MTDFQSILNKEFLTSVYKNGGEIFFVGGCVRDFLLEKSPKDIDVVIRNIEYQQLVELLTAFGKVDVVGESFGVIKFKEFITNFEIEIALPRIDTKDQQSKGHKGIVANSDPFLSIESDLFRRDFTINSIGLNSKLEFIDPYNGINDLNKGIISATNKDAFKDDPLRMLRAIQFAARFNFDIEEETYQMIKQQASSIKEISPERILMEFEKVFSKNGNVNKFYSLLKTTGLYESIYGFKSDYFDYSVRQANTLAEFLFFSCSIQLNNCNVYSFLQQKFKIDNNTIKICKALEKFFNDLIIYKPLIETLDGKYALDAKKVMFDVLQIYPDAYNLKSLKSDFQLYIDKNYPKSLNELALTGEDLVKKLRFKESPLIGEIRRALLKEILNDKISNNYEDCLKFVESNFAVL